MNKKLHESGQRSEEEREIKPSGKPATRIEHPILSTDPGPPADSVCICYYAHSSFTVRYPLLYGPHLLPSPSPPLFVDNPRRCALFFYPSAR